MATEQRGEAHREEERTLIVGLVSAVDAVLGHFNGVLGGEVEELGKRRPALRRIGRKGRARACAS